MNGESRQERSRTMVRIAFENRRQEVYFQSESKRKLDRIDVNARILYLRDPGNCLLQMTIYS